MFNGKAFILAALFLSLLKVLTSNTYAETTRDELRLRRDHPTTQKYFTLWKEYFCEKNHFTDDDFNRLISVEDAFVEGFKNQNYSWARFRVRYQFHYSWFNVEYGEYVDVLLNPDRKEFAYLNISRGTFVQEDEFRKLLKVQRESLMPSIKPLMFENETEAKAAFSKEMSKLQIEKKFIPILNRIEDGEPILVTDVRLNEKKNECAALSLNLLTAKFKVQMNPCITWN